MSFKNSVEFSLNFQICTMISKEAKKYRFVNTNVRKQFSRSFFIKPMNSYLI
jgi:hypothetical protein